ncbi:hypothetical protein [Novosphingobium sp. Gsoil 351]|uniref:hypothetical protein n=1 Tax=Novosphingobium sp. Gsoil 351 TaxID=2675225 RepID=UPI0012B46E5D|nr:hypothetical protein [Novosphingobium sp. Gsoil 351]QGN55595.1 hypothetical protein GKE62_14600 [Novosphingobium sp. Gsoil 351]
MNALHQFIRTASLGVAAVAFAAAPAAQAQFGGLSLGSLGKKSSTADTSSSGCPEGKKKSVGASIMGSMAGSMANRVGGRFASFVPLPEFATILTNAIACKLDQKEQKQAADATLAVTRGDDSGQVMVGQTAEWTSASRKDVKGKSTIVAVEQAPAAPAGNPGKGKGKDKQLAMASQCITVSDVVIVNGEETTANKRMCKAPGQARYSLMA